MVCLVVLFWFGYCSVCVDFRFGLFGCWFTCRLRWLFIVFRLLGCFAWWFSFARICLCDLLVAFAGV